MKVEKKLLIDDRTFPDSYRLPRKHANVICVEELDKFFRLDKLGNGKLPRRIYGVLTDKKPRGSNYVTITRMIHRDIIVADDVIFVDDERIEIYSAFTDILNDHFPDKTLPVYGWIEGDK